MKTPITIFDRASGQIMRWRRIAFGTEPIILPPEWDWIEGRFDDGQFHIDPGTRQPVPLKTFDVEVAANRITGIPPGSWAIVDLKRVPAADAEPNTIDDGELTLTVNLPHVAIVTLQCPLHAPLLEIEVPCEP